MSKANFDGIVAYVRDHWAICACIAVLSVGAIKDGVMKTAQISSLQADVKQLKETQPRLFVVEAKLDSMTTAINSIALDVREIRANQNDKGK